MIREPIQRPRLSVYELEEVPPTPPPTLEAASSVKSNQTLPWLREPGPYLIHSLTQLLTPASACGDIHLLTYASSTFPTCMPGLALLYIAAAAPTRPGPLLISPLLSSPLLPSGARPAGSLSLSLWGMNAKN